MKSPFVVPKSVLNLIFPPQNCCEVKNIYYLIVTVSSMYCCTSHVFPLESGGRNCSSCSCHSVYLAHWFILTDISTSNFSADNLLKVIEFGPPFSSLIAKGSWIVNTLRVSLPLTHWKKYRSFVDDNYFFFAVQKHRQVLWCQPGTQEYFEILFFSVFFVLSRNLKITKWN